MGCHALLQGILPTQGLNPHLLDFGFFITSITWEAPKGVGGAFCPSKLGTVSPPRYSFLSSSWNWALRQCSWRCLSWSVWCIKEVKRKCTKKKNSSTLFLYLNTVYKGFSNCFFAVKKQLVISVIPWILSYSTLQKWTSSGFECSIRDIAEIEKKENEKDKNWEF